MIFHKTRDSRVRHLLQGQEDHESGTTSPDGH